MPGWESLTSFQQVLWVLAVLSTGFFLLNTLLAFVGVGDVDLDGDVPDADIDFDGDADAQGEHGAGEILEYLTLRNVAAFTLGFSWTGLLFYAQLGTLSLLPAVPVGGAFGFLNHWLSKSLRGLESSGNANPSEAIGQTARVSVQVNENMKGKGKVVVRVRDRELELLALTEDDTPLNRGDRVQVYYVDDGVLWVSKEDRLGLESL